MRLNSVVLPAPFGPISAIRAPAGTVEADVVADGQAAEPLGDAVEREGGSQRPCSGLAACGGAATTRTATAGEPDRG